MLSVTPMAKPKNEMVPVPIPSPKIPARPVAGSDGAFICNCGSGAVRVGLLVDTSMNSFINRLECVECGRQYPIPDLTQFPRVTMMPLRPPSVPDITFRCINNGECPHGELCRTMGLCIDRAKNHFG